VKATHRRADSGRREHWLTVADAIPLHALSYSRGAIPRGDELMEKRWERIVELRKAKVNPGASDACMRVVSGLRPHCYFVQGTPANGRDEMNEKRDDLDASPVAISLCRWTSY